MKWFQHDTDMHLNRKIKKLIRTHGATGYAFWCLLLEKIYGEEDCFQIQADKLWIEDISEDLRLGDYRTPIRILDTLAEIGLISSQLWQEHVIHCPSIAQRGDRYIVKRAQEAEKKARYRAKKRREEKELSTVDNEWTGGQTWTLSTSDPDPDPELNSKADLPCMGDLVEQKNCLSSECVCADFPEKSAFTHAPLASKVDRSGSEPAMQSSGNGLMSAGIIEPIATTTAQSSARDTKSAPPALVQMNLPELLPTARMDATASFVATAEVGMETASVGGVGVTVVESADGDGVTPRAGKRARKAKPKPDIDFERLAEIYNQYAPPNWARLTAELSPKRKEAVVRCCINLGSSCDRNFEKILGGSTSGFSVHVDGISRADDAPGLPGSYSHQSGDIQGWGAKLGGQPDFGGDGVGMCAGVGSERSLPVLLGSSDGVGDGCDRNSGDSNFLMMVKVALLSANQDAWLRDPAKKFAIDYLLRENRVESLVEKYKPGIDGIIAGMPWISEGNRKQSEGAMKVLQTLERIRLKQEQAGAGTAA